MSIWRRAHAPAELDALHRDTLPGLLGIRFLEVGADHLRAEMPVDRRHVQPFGILHGGASVVLAETIGSVAGTLATPPGQHCVGLEVNANHLAAVRPGDTLTATCRPARIGRQVQVWQVELHRGDGVLACVARLTTLVVGGDLRPSALES